jgi:hypothetical protein
MIVPIQVMGFRQSGSLQSFAKFILVTMFGFGSEKPNCKIKKAEAFFLGVANSPVQVSALHR